MIYDINLIPKAKKKLSGETVFLTVTLCLCCLAAAVFFGVYMPLQQKFDLKDQIREQEDELASYSDSQEYYTTLLNQVEAAGQTDTILQAITGSNLKMTKIMDDLEKSIPKDIIINKMSMTSGILTIEGTAPSYLEVAQYIVNLRKLDNVISVTFTNAKKVEEDTQAVSDQSELQDFTVYVGFNSTDVISGLLAQTAAEQAAAGQASGEEAAADETD